MPDTMLGAEETKMDGTVLSQISWVYVTETKFKLEAAKKGERGRI